MLEKDRPRKERIHMFKSSYAVNINFNTKMLSKLHREKENSIYR